MKRIIVGLGILLALVVALAACGGGDGSAEAGSSSGGVTLNDDYPDALPVSSQLAIGTLLLEGTEDAVTVEQAGELLPAWQMLQALQSSGTAAQAELDAVLNQIQRAMTAEQLTAIKEMQLTPDNMIGLVQERGLGRGFAGGAGGMGAGGFQPPADVAPGDAAGRGSSGGAGGPGGPGGAGGLGGPPGGFVPGGDFGGGGNFSPEEQGAALAERTNRLAGTAMTGMLISMLEARAKGTTWEVAAPNQEFGLQRALLGAIAEATGLDQQEIATQTREGVTLREIAEANGADVDEVVAQVVAAETERVNQAVTDGSLEQADADQWLADLEARVREMLEGTLQFGGRGVPGQP